MDEIRSFYRIRSGPDGYTETPVELADLEMGDLFRAEEADGELIKHDDLCVFRACSSPYLNDDGKMTVVFQPAPFFDKSVSGC